jgi:branched-subunit amino acid aminotransferase/4-amino-4-deoxychorismate lyase
VQVLKAQMDAKSKGFTDVLYLDSVHKRYLEEVSSCNVFVVKGGVVATPAIRGTILPGITRKSVVELARDRGYKVAASHHLSAALFRAWPALRLYTARTIFGSSLLSRTVRR